jgi:WD40 repeat protein
MRHPFVWSLVFVLASAAAAVGQGPVLPSGQKEPYLCLETGGPTSLVSALAFSPDGEVLYAAGWDKVIRVWVRDRNSGRFLPDKVVYRVPTAAGLDGAINSMALSPDGVWLAAGGRMLARGESGYRDVGVIVPTVSGAYSSEMHQDRGLIFLFNTQTQEVRPLRGHWGQVLALTFAPHTEGKPPLLVGVAQEWDDSARKYVGGVRLWDVEKGKPLDELLGLPDPLNTRPGLAVWHTGPRVEQVRVALAWGDGKFRVWDLERKRDRLRVFADGTLNNTAGFLPEPQLILTGSYDGEKNGHMQAWRGESGQEVQPDPKRRAVFPPDRGKDDRNKPGAIRALTLLSSQAGGPLDLAALVVRVAAETGDLHKLELRLVEVGPANFGRMRAKLELWKGGNRMPVLTAAAGGRFLAVAGREDSALFVFSVNDLLKQPAPEPQELRGAGATMRAVAWAVQAEAKQDRHGLLLSPSPLDGPGAALVKPAAGDVLFDFAAHRLTTDKTGWKVAQPAAAGWSVSHESGKEGTVLLVSSDGKLVKRVPLKPTQIVTAYALMPPQPHVAFPLLAVAFVDEGRPRLYLYNAASGEPIRWLTSHSYAIRSVAFSPNGKLLASVADDQTVAVWSVGNKDRILGRRGMVYGFFVQDKNETVVVADVDPAGLAAGKLASGDIIESIVTDKEVRPIKTRIAFFEEIAARQVPGSKVTLRLRAKTGLRDVLLPVGQAQDERKPLFSLFLTRHDGPQRHWIGWSPIGPYESSGLAAERYLGWHFNTGRPDAPTRFAFAHEYRKEYRREGILNDLVTQGTLTDALEAWRQREAVRILPTPTLTLALVANGQDVPADERGTYLVRQPQARLALRIDGFPEDRIAAVTWKVDDGAEQPFEGNELRWTARVSAAKRGEHRVRVVLRTVELVPKEHVAELVFRYQPPAPEIASTLPVRQVVKNATFTVEAAIKPGLDGEPVQVTLSHRHEGKELLAGADQLQSQKVKQNLTLRLGDNEVRLVAVNTNARRDQAEAETTRRTMIVTYVLPKMTPPPQVILTEVVPLPNGPAHKMEGDRPKVVDTAKVRLLGVVKADEPLTRCRLIKDDGPGQSLAKFTADKVKEWTVREDVELAPGTQTFRIVAQTAESKESTAAVTILYQPALPKVELLEPLSNRTLYEGEDPPILQLKARLSAPRDRRPFQAAVLLDGQEVAVQPTLDERKQLLTAKVQLHPGENRLQVRLTNQWEAISVSEVVTVSYARPPRQIRFEPAQPGAKPFLDLVALVDSPLPLLASSVKATINGRPHTNTEVSKPVHEGAPWRVLLKALPLVEGVNVVTLTVSNREGVARKPGVIEIVFKPPQAPKPPLGEILEPQSETPVNPNDPTITVKFRVQSASPLQALDLVHESGRSVQRHAIKAPRPGEVHETKISLLAGVNSLRLEAVNDGGKAFSAPVVVTYSPPPVRVFLERLEVKDADQARVLLPQIRPDGRLTFPESRRGRARLHGRVVWDADKDEQFKATHLVHVFVNGFRQETAPLSPTADRPRERTFAADLVFNRAADNLVEVALPSVKQDASNRVTFTVPCKEPVGSQRLHLLLVSLNAQDEQQLTALALAALQVRPTPTGQLLAPAFDQITVYEPLTDFRVTPGEIYKQLSKIERAIERQTADAAANDVVVVYYQGSEALDPARVSYFSTSYSRHDPELYRSAVPCESLARRMAETRGLPLLLLDVAAPGRALDDADRMARWSQGLRVGLLRYARLTDRDSPADTPHLLADLAEATRSADTLEKVSAYLGAKLSPEATSGNVWVSPKDPARVFERRLPDTHAGLTIGRKPSDR